MKKLILSVIATLAAGALMLGAAAAQEQESACTITNTGPNSTNIAECVEEDEFVITCTNNTVLVVDNNQLANSGNSITINNTNNTGTTSTGQAVNVNVTNANINVGCAVAAAVTPPPAPTPTPSPTPVAAQAVGGQGQGAAVSELPKTGDSPMAETAVVVASSLGLAAIAARVGLSAYRHYALK